MKTKAIEKCLAKARHFHALADPDTNHLQATRHSTMLPGKALAPQWGEIEYENSIYLGME